MKAGAPGSLKPGPDVPPVPSTLPSGSIVRFICRRARFIEPVVCQVGPGTFRSITSAVAVGGSPPPARRILPGSYITADPYSRDAFNL